MQSTKSQIQIQFNWIFVLIVGVVILTFFITLISGQTKTSDQAIAINLAQRVKTILSSSEQQAGTMKEYHNLPPLEITFTCDSSEDVYQYAISGTHSIDTKYNIFFSPRVLNSNILYTWTEDWSIPYHVANFLYLTNNKFDYVFYNGTSLFAMNTLYEGFPKNFSKRLWNGTKDKNLHMDETTYVFFTQQMPSGSSLPLTFKAKKGKIIVIQPSIPSQPFSQGTIYFLPLSRISTPIINTLDLKNLLSSASNSTYLGKASLYGAIFSENKPFYECTMNKAIRRLQILTFFQYYRTQEEVPLVSSNCAYLLNNSPSPIPACTLGNGAANCLLAINTTLFTNNFSYTLTKNLQQELFSLDKINNQIASLWYCPAIY